MPTAARLAECASDLFEALEADEAAKALEIKVLPAYNLRLKGAAREAVKRKAHAARMRADELMQAALAKVRAQ